MISSPGSTVPRRRTLPLILLALITAVGPLTSCTTGTARRTAQPADVTSVDAILAAVYDVISGPPHQARDWDRFLSLFRPDARLIASKGDSDSGYETRARTPEEYAEEVGPILEKRGFYEVEIHRVEERFGPVVHAFSTYESRRDPAADPIARGVNSIQLFWDGTRWWIVTIAWYDETSAHPIPDRYLP